ncbi:MAG: NUDIX hydrolase [Candidatus Nealsonbacteria bacterium]
MTNPERKEIPKRHFTASALIFNERNEVLLLKHKKLGVWLYPGGHIAENETPDETLLREVKEETGLSVEILSNRDQSLGNKNVEVLYNPYAILCEFIPASGSPHYHIDMIYLGLVNGRRKLQLNDKESEDIGWFSLDEIDKLPLFPNFRVLLKKVLTERKNQ